MHDPSNSKNWLSARSAAFATAELEARQALSETIRNMISSDRGLVQKIFGGDESPAPMQAVADQLSLTDKSRVLAGKALDAEIKKYDPNWTGEESRRAGKIATLQERLDQNASNSTAVFASGAFAISQCEGPAGSDGKYSVLVGLAWSPVIEKVAESIWDPSVKVPPANPQGQLAEQFDELTRANSDWMAYTEGARVFTDEKGERVVVGFGVAPSTELGSADESRARLRASVAIQRFVGEKLVASQTDKTQYEYRHFSDGSAASFDSSTYYNKIEAVSKELRLSGAAVVRSWRGEHPWSKAGMQVVAVAWSQAWANDSSEIANAIQSAERRMQAKGAVPQPVSSPAGPSDRPVATRARRGASSSAKDF